MKPHSATWPAQPFGSPTSENLLSLFIDKGDMSYKSFAPPAATATATQLYLYAALAFGLMPILAALATSYLYCPSDMSVRPRPSRLFMATLHSVFISSLSLTTADGHRVIGQRRCVATPTTATWCRCSYR